MYTLIQRQVSLYRHSQHQQIPGTKGPTTTPTGAVGLSRFATGMMVQVPVDTREMRQVYRLPEHHLMICDALGLDRSWYEIPTGHQNSQIGTRPP